MSSENGTRIVKSGCFCCHAGCGILVHVKDDRVVDVVGDPDHPHNRGKICVKGRHSIETLYHKDRLLYPLKRVGKRGEGKWDRISWDEALDTSAAELKRVIDRYGPLAVTGGDGTKGDEVAWIIDLFLLKLGTTNRTGSGRAQCMMPRREASKAAFGNYYTIDFEGGPECMILWADQLEVSNHNSVLGWKVQENLKRGAKLIVIDPRRTAYARRADLWLRIRPSTDVVLAMSMIHVIIEEGLFDREFVTKWTNAPYLVDTASGDLLRDAEGRYLVWNAENNEAAPADTPGVKLALEGSFEVAGLSCKTAWQLLRERCAAYPPGEAAPITWLKAEDIVRAARLYATTRPAAISWGVGLDMNINSHQGPRALTILECLTGNVDNQGGNYYPTPRCKVHREFVEEFAATLPDESFENQLGGDRFRLGSGVTAKQYANNPAVLRAILTGEPYPVRAWVAMGGNPVMTWSNSREVCEALLKLDFHMGFDHFMTPSLQLADIVLPAPTQFEKERLAGPHSYSPFGNVMCQRAIEPLGEVRDEFEVSGEILRRMGLGESWPWRTIVAFYEERLAKAGISWNEVTEAGGLQDKLIYRKHETAYFRESGGFPTRTGKAEIYCTRWHENGYDPLPFFTEPPETPYSSPEVAEEYPFTVITGARVPYFFHTQQHHEGTLRGLHPEPLTCIHPDSSARLGISNGDWICIESPRGRCAQKAKLFDGLDPRVISVEHAWWFPEEEPSLPHLYGAFRSNANTLTPNKDPFLDRAFGGYTLRGFQAKVYKITEEEAMSIGLEEEAAAGVSDS
jgi:anaerobic selenocysteine-containing dehydrogenase